MKPWTRPADRGNDPVAGLPRLVGVLLPAAILVASAAAAMVLASCPPAGG